MDKKGSCFVYTFPIDIISFLLTCSALQVYIHSYCKRADRNLPAVAGQMGQPVPHTLYHIVNIVWTYHKGWIQPFQYRENLFAGGEKNGSIVKASLILDCSNVINRVVIQIGFNAS